MQKKSNTILSTLYFYWGDNPVDFKIKFLLQFDKDLFLLVACRMNGGVGERIRCLLAFFCHIYSHSQNFLHIPGNVIFIEILLYMFVQWKSFLFNFGIYMVLLKTNKIYFYWLWMVFYFIQMKVKELQIYFFSRIHPIYLVWIYNHFGDKVFEIYTTSIRRKLFCFKICFSFVDLHFLDLF